MGRDSPEEGSGGHLWVIGVGALGAWLAMLWFMFGDVV